MKKKSGKLKDFVNASSRRERSRVHFPADQGVLRIDGVAVNLIFLRGARSGDEIGAGEPSVFVALATRGRALDSERFGSSSIAVLSRPTLQAIAGRGERET